MMRKPDRLSAADVSQLVHGGRARLLDVRCAPLHGRAHVPGSVSVSYVRKGFLPRVEEQMPPGASIVVLAQDPFVAARAAGDLAGTGRDVAGWMIGLGDWEDAGYPLLVVPQLRCEMLLEAPTNWDAVDVREPDEWRSGTIPGARRIPLGRLEQELSALPVGRRYAVVCAHGNRSQRGAATLLQAGREAASVEGGMAVWLAQGLPVER